MVKVNALRKARTVKDQVDEERDLATKEEQALISVVEAIKKQEDGVQELRKLFTFFATDIHTSDEHRAERIKNVLAATLAKRFQGKDTNWKALFEAKDENTFRSNLAVIKITEEKQVNLFLKLYRSMQKLPKSEWTDEAILQQLRLDLAEQHKERVKRLLQRIREQLNVNLTQFRAISDNIAVTLEKAKQEGLKVSAESPHAEIRVAMHLISELKLLPQGLEEKRDSLLELLGHAEHYEEVDNSLLQQLKKDTQEAILKIDSYANSIVPIREDYRAIQTIIDGLEKVAADADFAQKIIFVGNNALSQCEGWMQKLTLHLEALKKNVEELHQYLHEHLGKLITSREEAIADELRDLKGVSLKAKRPINKEENKLKKQKNVFEQMIKQYDAMEKLIAGIEEHSKPVEHCIETLRIIKRLHGKNSDYFKDSLDPQIWIDALFAFDTPDLQKATKVTLLASYEELSAGAGFQLFRNQKENLEKIHEEKLAALQRISSLVK